MQKSIRQLFNNNTKLNILCMPTHERIESLIAKTNHNFYSIRHPQLKDWVYKHAPKPNNYFLYDISRPPHHVTFDLVLSQSKFGQYELLAPMAQSMGIPLVTIEHTASLPNWPIEEKQLLSQMTGDLNLFIADWQIDAWGFQNQNNKVIYHAVDSELFKPLEKNKNHIFSVVNDWINRGSILGFPLWQKLTDGLPRYVRGDTKGFSEAAPSVEILAQEYGESKIFLNTSLYSALPTSLLEAMSAGCAVVSTNTCGIPEIIEHGVNGLISSNQQELRKFLEELIHNDKLAQELGANARKTILEKCSLTRFVQEYDEAFRSVL